LAQHFTWLLILSVMFILHPPERAVTVTGLNRGSWQMVHTQLRPVVMLVLLHAAMVLRALAQAAQNA